MNTIETNNFKNVDLSDYVEAVVTTDNNFEINMDFIGCPQEYNNEN